VEDIFEKLRNISWLRIIKSLAFDGGASSTKWVYIACAAVVNLCLVAMTTSLCYVYVHSQSHEVNIALVTLIGSTITIVVGIPATSANLRRATNATARAAKDGDPLAINSTPISADATTKEEQ
jgi:hypothetical protein